MFELAFFALLALSHAQKPFSACFSGSGTTAVPISTAFARCNYLNNTLNRCTAGPQASVLPCYCAQNVFDAMFECQNEERECLDSNDLNNQFSNEVSLWHKSCDPIIAFSATTPPISSLTTFTGNMNNPVFCSEVQSQCDFGSTYVTSCFSAFGQASQSTQLSHCVCNARVLSAASVCEYDNNVTCLGTPAATSNIALWEDCPKQVSEFLATRVTTTSSLPPSLSPIPTPGPSASTTRSPGPTFGSSAGPTSSSSAASRRSNLARSRTAALLAGLSALGWFHF